MKPTTRLTWIALLGAALIGVAPMTGLAQGDDAPPSLLMEKAIFAEQSSGDIDQAIELYRRIIARAAADRACAAQAHLRLAVCLIKKGRASQAVEHLDAIRRDYKDQADIVAQGETLRKRALGGLAAAEVRRIVDKTVAAISTCAESDPRLPEILAGLEGLDEKTVIARLAEHLDSDTPAVRRSAIFILWKGAFADPGPAGDRLVAFCSHEKELTRGMAALALGEMKIDAGYDAVADMARSDSGGYARRCAAYALGLYGRPEAKALLQKIAKDDKDALVRANAEAALKMLPKQAVQNLLPPDVMGWIIQKHYEAVGRADAKGIRVNTHIYGADGVEMMSGGLLMYRNTTAEPVSGEVLLGNFGPERPDFTLIDEQTQTQDYTVRKNPWRDRYGVYWTPDGPIAPGANRLLGYIKPKARKLPIVGGTPTLTMNNDFGGAVLENFFLVTPVDVKLIETSRAYQADAVIVSYHVYLFQSDQPANTHNEVHVKLGVPDGGKASVAAPSVADRKKAEALAAEAWRLWNQQAYDQAEGKFLESVALNPTDANAFNGLGWSQFNQGQRTAAAEAFNKAVALDPKQAGALNGLGWIAKVEGRLDEAVGFWTRAVEVLPTATAALRGLALTLDEQGRYDKALSYYAQWLKADPDNAEARAGLAKVRKQAAQMAVRRAKLVNWVETFFSGNYRDITARKTLAWGDPEEDALGNWSITYTFEATIRDKDKKVIAKTFTFKPDGAFVSAETISSEPLKASSSSP